MAFSAVSLILANFLFHENIKNLPGNSWSFLFQAACLQYKTQREIHCSLVHLVCVLLNRQTWSYSEYVWINPKHCFQHQCSLYKQNKLEFV